MNHEQVEQSKALLGKEVVEMLLQVHQDALWILENLGVGCKQPEILEVFVITRLNKLFDIKDDEADALADF